MSTLLISLGICLALLGLIFLFVWFRTDWNHTSTAPTIPPSTPTAPPGSTDR